MTHNGRRQLPLGYTRTTDPKLVHAHELAAIVVTNFQNVTAGGRAFGGAEAHTLPPLLYYK